MKNILVVLLLVVGLFGSDSEEIGVPYVEQSEGKTKSSVLDPNGKYFYTLVGETVTKWEFDPIKKVSSFKVELPKNGEIFISNISSDSKKMLIWNLKSLSLFNLETQKKIKTEIIESHTKFRLRWAEMDGTIFKTIYRKNWNTTIYKEYDTENLKIIKNLALPVACDDPDSISDDHIYINNTKLFRVIFQQASGCVAIFDKNTLKPLNKNWSISAECIISLDKKNIYCGHGVKGYRHINLETLESETLTKKEFDNKKYLQNSRLNISLFKELSLVFNYRRKIHNKRIPSIIFYNNVTNEELATFYQFSNDWILIAPNGNFEGSKNIKKYLKMKTLSGKVVPINNATFKKYNKAINLKG